MDTCDSEHASIEEGSVGNGEDLADGEIEIGLAEVSARPPAVSTMKPFEVLAKLQRGETIERTRIVGLKLKGEFPLPVRFREVTLVQLVVEKATFADEVSFENCTLERPTFARKSQYEKGLSLAGSTLTKPSLRGLTVKGVFRCEQLRVRGKFLLETSRFEEKLKFWEAQFRGWVDFKNCEFLAPVDLRSIHVDEGFYFSGCQFRSEVLMRGAVIHKKLEANATRFEGLLDLSKAKLYDYVYLEGIEQGPAQQFAFANALAERILIRPDQLQGRLASEERGDYAQAIQEYGLLKRNFEGLHRYDQEDWAFYRFKVNQRRCKTRSWRQPWTMVAGVADWLFLDQGCGYGTNPARAVRGALLIILGFALIYIAGIEAFDVEVGHEPFDGRKTTVANRLMIGTLASISAFTSGFGDIRGAAHGWMNLPLIAESLLGTLLWGLFIVAFSRKVIR